MAVVSGADGDFRVEFDAHAEIKFEGWSGEREGASDIALVEAVEEIVGWNAVFHNIEIGRAFEEMLSLTGCVLGSDLVAVYALDGKTFV